MSDDLKSLLKVGFTNSIQSFVPVLVWTLLGMMFHDGEYANGFIITYPYQFVSSLLYHIIFKAQLKSEVKDKVDSHDSAYTGIKLLFCIYSIVFGISIIFRYSIFNILSIDSVNESIFVFGLAQMFMDWILYAVVTTEQYDNKNFDAFILVLFWYVSKLVLIIVLGAGNANVNNALMFINAYMLVLIVVITTKYCKQQKFEFSILDGIKYSLYDIPSDFGMIIIYVFGISTMSSNSTIVLSAYNMMSMCTDTQWDILGSAIDTIGTLKVKTDEFIQKRKRLFISAIEYSVLLFGTSLLLIAFCSIIPTYRDSVNFGMVWIMFLLECSGFPLYGLRYMMSSWVAVEHPNGYSFIITAITYVVRFITMAMIKSDYRVCLGVVSSCIIGNLCHIFIYRCYMSKTSLTTIKQ